jgi:hypothetical protein
LVIIPSVRRIASTVPKRSESHSNSTRQVWTNGVWPGIFVVLDQWFGRVSSYDIVGEKSCRQSECKTMSTENRQLRAAKGMIAVIATALLAACSLSPPPPPQPAPPPYVAPEPAQMPMHRG